MEHDFLLTVEAGEAGQRLDKFLVARLPAFSRARLQALLKEGAIVVNGREAKASRELSAGEVIGGRFRRTVRRRRRRRICRWRCYTRMIMWRC